MFVDFVLNQTGHGPVGEALGGVRFDVGLLRPYIEDDGRVYVTVNTGRMEWNEEAAEYQPVYESVRYDDLPGSMRQVTVNATTLRKEEYINIDRKVVMAARQRLRLWDDLQKAAGTGGFNGMAKTTHEYEAMSDPGEALVDMDGISDGTADSPLFKLRSVPLPITHSSFWFSERRIATSRNTGTPLPTTMAEACGRRVAEMVERTCIGLETGMNFGTVSTGPTAHDGNSQVYGITTFANRTTKTDLTTPTGSNPDAILADVLEMIELLQSDGFYGPYTLYHSTSYSRYLNDDYFRSGSTSAVRSVRQRLLETEDVKDIRRLDYLTSGYQLILAQITSEYMEAINGMDITTFQWEAKGGLQKFFKVGCIHVPLFKSDYNGNAPIVHGTTS